MRLVLNRGARGPAWERWAILEEQRGDMAFAGEMILTFTDDSMYADVDCTIMYNRKLADAEIEEVLSAAFSVVSGRGHVTVCTAQELTCRAFDMLDEDEEEPCEN